MPQSCQDACRLAAAGREGGGRGSSRRDVAFLEWRCCSARTAALLGQSWQRWACCGVGGAAAGQQWRGGMTEAADVPLHCWGGNDVVGT